MSIKPYGDLGYFGIWPLQENSDQKLLQSNRFHRPPCSSAVCLIQNVKKKSDKMDLIVATGCCATATTGPWFRNLWTKCKKKKDIISVGPSLQWTTSQWRYSLYVKSFSRLKSLAICTGNKSYQRLLPHTHTGNAETNTDTHITTCTLTI